jgi:hypothetical protein
VVTLEAARRKLERVQAAADRHKREAQEQRQQVKAIHQKMTEMQSGAVQYRDALEAEFRYIRDECEQQQEELQLLRKQLKGGEQRDGSVEDDDDDDDDDDDNSSSSEGDDDFKECNATAATTTTTTTTTASEVRRGKKSPFATAATNKSRSSRSNTPGLADLSNVSQFATLTADNTFATDNDTSLLVDVDQSADVL